MPMEVLAMITLAHAEPRDADAIVALYKELDEFYGVAVAADVAAVRAERVRSALFGDPPAGRALLAWDGAVLAGFAGYQFIWPSSALTTSLCFGCETRLGVSTYTPYVTSEGQDGTGNTYVTFVNTAKQMVVDQLDFSSCSASSGSGVMGVDNQDVITSDTTNGGPALAVSGYGTGSEQFWMVWAGSGSTPTINIAQYTPGSQALTHKTTETSHTTTADIGEAFNGNDGKVFDTYCGTNNIAYYQYFTPGSGGISGLTQKSVNNDSCGLVTTNGWTSGGVGAAYDYNSDSLRVWQAWDSSACSISDTSNCKIFLAPIPNP
jgi:hypothetical protein